MNIFKSAGYIFRALKKSNKPTMMGTMKNVYKQYGWQGLKDAVVNKAHGRPIIPQTVVNPAAAPIGQDAPNTDCAKQIISEKNRIGYELFEEQQYELTKAEILQNLNTMEFCPLISVIMPMYNAPLHWLEMAVESIRNQYYDTWELCIVDDGSIDGRGRYFIAEVAKTDKRIRLKVLEKNTGISGASNAALEMARGEYIALIDQDDEITADAFYWFIAEINKNRNADFIYSDECKIGATPSRQLFDFLLKPDWSPSLLLNYMYTGHLTVYRTELIRRIGGFRSDYDFSQDYDLAIRASEHAKKISHVERILYFWRAVPDSGAADGKSYALTTNIMAVKDQYDRQGLSAVIERREFGNYVKLKMEHNPKVSIIVPTDDYENVKILIKYINTRTSYTNYEIIPVVNSLVTKKLDENLPYYKNILNVCRYDKTFNFSDKCNEGAKAATGEVLIFLNDDAYPLTADWIERLLDILYLPGVGGVSPAMLFDDTHKIQYAGGITGHPMLAINGPAYYCKDFDDVSGNKIHQLLVRDISILSGAGMAMKKDIFLEIDGFDAVNTPNGHSDVDLSFRLWNKGLRCVYTPFSCLVHAGKGTWSVRFKKHKTDLYCLKQYREYIEHDRYFTDSMKRYEARKKDLEYQIFYPELLDNSKEYRADLLLISHELSRTGGPVVLFDMAKQLKEEGFFVVIASPIDGPLREDMCREGFIVVIDESVKRYRYVQDVLIPKNDFWQFDSFICNFDLVIICAMLNYNIVSRYNNTKIPILWWLHEGDFTLNTMARLIPESLSNNITVKCGGEYVQDQLKSFGVNYNTEVLLYGVEDIADKVKNRSKEKLKFLLAGSFEERKGHDLFIQAIEEMPEEYRNRAEYMFIGKIHQQHVYDMVEDFCSKNKNAMVMQTVTREELFKIYEEISCVITPSRDDPMPVVLTEALMLSKICICSDKTGTSYYIKDGESGFVFKNEDYKELAEKMMYIIDNYPNLGKLRENGRKLYDQYFSMEIFNKNLKSVLNETLPENAING